MIIDCPPEVVRAGLPVVAVIDLPPDETDGPSSPLILFRPRPPDE